MTEQSPAARSVAECQRLFLAEQKTIRAAVAQIGRRHRLSRHELEELASDAALKLIENDYLVLRKFQGRSSLQTYLTVVVHRVFLDRRIAEWGKWRPSALARREGPSAVLLEQLMVKQGLPFDEACGVIKTVPGVTFNHSALERLAARLPVRRKSRSVPLDEVGDIAASVDASSFLYGDAQASAADQVSAALTKELAALSAEDRRLIRGRFFGGPSVMSVARMTSQEPKAVYRHLARLLKRLRSRLEERGISSAAVRESFQDL
jgi:RNA polymerase sigma factor (sigma-70 family)